MYFSTKLYNKFMYVKEEITHSLTIEKSVFICFIKRIKSEEEYRNYLTEIRKKYHDCSHVCSAMILNDIKRSSDDGEPSGTAGRPILNVLEKNGLNETCALVVRYFGGIKLGTGGLTRAYSNAVIETLDEAILAEEVSYPSYTLSVNYETANRLEYFMSKETILINKEYGEEVTFNFALDNKDKLTKILELTKGKEASYIGDITKERIVK